MRHLILTNDYEIFGNGTGDVMQHMIKPTARMAAICEECNCRMTVFFELEEYLAFERFDAELQQNLGYSPAGVIRDQVTELARRGHDIQLHLHPEWHGARYERGNWILSPDRPTVDSLFPAVEDVKAYISERKAVIETLLEKAGVVTKVRVYRAGAFSAQPGERLLAGLRSAGFVIDSSVCKGLVRPGVYDFRSAPSAKDPWRITTDVSVSNASGSLFEFPIYSRMGRRWQQLSIDRLMAKFSWNVPAKKRRQMVEQLQIQKTPLGILKFMASATPIKFDYHNLSPKDLFKMALSAPPAPAGLPDVLVSIGHSKEHRDDGAFKRFLKLVSRAENFKVVTFDYMASLVENALSSPTCSGAASASRV
jgi:hypothetical protein